MELTSPLQGLHPLTMKSWRSLLSFHETAARPIKDIYESLMPGSDGPTILIGPSLTELTVVG